MDNVHYWSLLISDVAKLVKASLLILIHIFIFSNHSYCQTLSESDIKKFAEQVNQQSEGVDIGNDITVRGALSIGRTLIYQYNVPENWRFPENMREEVISNVKTAGAARTFFLNNIDVDFHYYRGSSLIKKLSVKSNEFSTSSNTLGEYLSINDHPKSKGVNLKLKVPIGWEVKEGYRPNIVKKFVKDGNTYQILIIENATFFSRNLSKELLEDEDFVSEYVQESTSFLMKPEVIDKSVVTIDSYPALQFMVKGKMERTGLTLPMIMRCWVVFYEDKIVFLQSVGFDDAEFRVLEQLYFLITHSVIFPERYN